MPSVKFASTLTYLIPSLSILAAPTRELASQIDLEAQKLTFNSHLRTACVYGGAPPRDQLYALAHGAEIVVGTPGRINDFLSRNILVLEDTEFLVLDEADRMMDMGFEPQIRQICQDYDLPAKTRRKTFMFSATFEANVQRIGK